MGMLMLVFLAVSAGTKLPPLKAPPVPAKSGTVVVNTLTPGAKVFLDDKPAGSAPTTLKNVVPGEHKVKLRKIGYLMAEEVVVVEAGKTVELQLDLLPYAGVLVVKTTPKGGQIFVDGKGVGVTPFEGEISIGRRAVEIRRDGFQAYREVIQVGAGEVYKLDVTLQKGAAEVTADVPLVAVIPKKKKVKSDDDAIDIPLEAPPSLNPKAAITSGAPLGVTTKDTVASEAWYKKWWVWTIAGAVVATAVVVPIAVTQAQSGSNTPTAAFGNNGGPCALDFQIACGAARR
jgi:hypothetical protein